MSIALFHRTKGGIEHKDLIRIKNENLGVLSLLDHPRFQDASSVTETSEPSPDLVETKERTENAGEMGSSRYQPDLTSEKPAGDTHIKVEIPKYNQQPRVNPAEDLYRKYQRDQDASHRILMDHLMREQQKTNLRIQQEAIMRQQQQQMLRQQQEAIMRQYYQPGR